MTAQEMLDSFTDETLIAELKRRGRLREYGAQRAQPHNMDPAGDPGWNTWARYNMAVDMGHFIMKEAAKLGESRGIFGEQLLSAKAIVLVTPEVRDLLTPQGA